MSCGRPVPHPDEFLMGTDADYAVARTEGAEVAAAAATAAGGGGEGGGAVSLLSGRPPAGDLFMDFDSPRRAPYGMTYHHVQAWSVRDGGLVLERQAREMELAGRYRVPAAYIEVRHGRRSEYGKRGWYGSGKSGLERPWQRLGRWST
jgi:hypothetical protein